jgi:hypothetical protein
MSLASPYQSLSIPWQAGLCAASVLLTLVYAALLKRQGAPLDAVLAQGIVTLEVPWSSRTAGELVAALRAHDLIEVARLQVWLDFVFLLLYPLAFSTACALIAPRAGGSMLVYGMLAAWAVLLTAPLDAVENVAILRMLGGKVQAPWPQLSTVCAAIKFTLLFGAAAYVLIGLATWGVRCAQRT